MAGGGIFGGQWLPPFASKANTVRWLMNKFEELAEEGFEISKDTIKFLIDLPMNTFVFLCMVFLACIGWLSRHLTKRAPDAPKRGAKNVSSKSKSKNGRARR